MLLVRNDATNCWLLRHKWNKAQAVLVWYAEDALPKCYNSGKSISWPELVTNWIGCCNRCQCLHTANADSVQKLSGCGWTALSWRGVKDAVTGLYALATSEQGLYHDPQPNASLQGARDGGQPGMWTNLQTELWGRKGIAGWVLQYLQRELWGYCKWAQDCPAEVSAAAAIFACARRKRINRFKAICNRASMWKHSGVALAADTWIWMVLHCGRKDWDRLANARAQEAAGVKYFILAVVKWRDEQAAKLHLICTGRLWILY